MNYRELIKPESYEKMSSCQKWIWDMFGEIALKFYKDIKSKGHVNPFLNRHVLGDKKQLNRYIVNIIQDQNKFSKASNALISIRDTISYQKFIDRNSDVFSEIEFTYILFSQQLWIFSQSYEKCLNIFRSTLTTENMLTIRGKPVDKDINKSTISNILKYLSEDTDVTKDMENFLLKERQFRNGISHALLWYKNYEIHYLEKINSTQLFKKKFQDIISAVAGQGLITECLLWIVGKFIEEDFFVPI